MRRGAIGTVARAVAVAGILLPATAAVGVGCGNKEAADGKVNYDAAKTAELQSVAGAKDLTPEQKKTISKAIEDKYAKLRGTGAVSTLPGPKGNGGSGGDR